MNSRGLTLALIVVIVLYMLWTSGRLARLWSAVFG